MNDSEYATPNLSGRLEEFTREIPKVELHLHLEGAIPLPTLLTLVQRAGREQSIRTLDDLRRKLTYTDFAHFIDVYGWKNTFLAEEKDFAEIGYQVLRDLSRQNVKYVEAFYAPGDFRRQALSVQGITENLIEGKERAFRDFGIRSELIVDLVRDHGPDTGMRRVEEVTPYLGQGVVGIGLGGSEQEFPADPYASVYTEARKRGFRLTAHAGEVAGADSVWTVIEKLGVERIGHGIRAEEDPELMSVLERRRIPLEMCITSNLMTGVCQSIDAHPVKRYFQHGLMVTVNSDDPTMFGTSISQEYRILVQKLGFTVSELWQLNLNGIDASFMPDEEKELMKSEFEKQWQRVVSKYC